MNGYKCAMDLFFFLLEVYYLIDTYSNFLLKETQP